VIYSISAINKRIRLSAASGEKGVTLVEYVILACLISLTVIVAVTLLGRNISSDFHTAGTNIGEVDVAPPNVGGTGDSSGNGNSGGTGSGNASIEARPDSTGSGS